MASPEPSSQLPPIRSRLPIEPGETFNTPHRWGDAFELPSGEGRSVVSPLGFDGDVDDVIERLRAAMRAADRPDKYAPRGVDVPPPADPSPDEARLDHLRYLARWVGDTAIAQQNVDALERKRAEMEATKKSPSSADVARLHRARRHLDDCLERDAIKATRPEGDRCLGAGAWGDQVALSIVIGKDPDGHELLYAEGIDGPMTFSEICPICPEGEQQRALDRERQAEMRQRWAKKRLERLLGAAKIPARMLRLDLATYPHQDIARKAWRWYATHLREQQTKPPVRAVRPFLLLFGPNTRGKTGVAIGVLKLAVDRGSPAVVRTTMDLLDELRATYDPKNDACFAEILAALKSAPLLVLDDLGAERLSDYATDVFFSLFDYRKNELLPTILTTNLNPLEEPDGRPSELARWLGQRVYDRVAGLTNGIDFTHLPILHDPDPDPLPPQIDEFKDW